MQAALESCSVVIEKKKKKVIQIPENVSEKFDWWDFF